MCNKNNNRNLRRKKVKLWYVNFMKEQKCAHCGIDDHRVLTWHHLDPDKKFDRIANMLSCYSIKSILAEISKCICLCRNCHAIEEYETNGKVRKKELPAATFDI
jgi:hypothetical protein